MRIAVAPGRALAIASLAVLVCAGCGYRLAAGSRGATAPDAPRIALEFFDNQSSAPGFERMLADALVEEIARRGRLAPVYAAEGVPPELRLRGVIRSVSVVPYSYSSVGLAVESRIDLVLDVELLGEPGPERRWRHEGLSLGELFLSSADAQVRHTNREQALRRLASLAAQRIHDEVAEGL